MAAQSSGISATAPSFVSSTVLLRVHSIPSPRSLVYKLNKTGPSTDAYETPLAAGLQLNSTPLITALWVLPFRQFSIHFTVYLSSPRFLARWWQHSLLALYLSRELSHHRRLSDWSSMISFLEAMFTTPDHLFLHMPRDDIQYELLYHLSRWGWQAYSFLGPFSWHFANWGGTGFPPVLRYLSYSPWPFRDDQQWPRNDVQ